MTSWTWRSSTSARQSTRPMPSLTNSPASSDRRFTDPRDSATSAHGVLIDTQDWTYENRHMATRVKRTYNLSPATVRQVREMAEQYRVAPSQDAVVELAVDELERRLRDESEAAAWAGAASDPEFAAEASDLDAAYRTADRETWPA